MPLHGPWPGHCRCPGFTRSVPHAGSVSPGHPFLPEGGRARLGVCSTVAHVPLMGPHLVPQPPSHQVSRGTGDQRLTCSEDIFARTSGLGVPTTSMIRFSWSMSTWLRKGPTARHGLSWDPRPQILGHCPDPAVLSLGTVIPRWHGVGQRRQDCPERARAHLPQPLPCNRRPNPPPQPEPRIQSFPGKRAFPWSSSAMMQPTDQMSTEGGGAPSVCAPQVLPQRARGWTHQPRGHIQAPS